MGDRSGPRERALGECLTGRLVYAKTIDAALRSLATIVEIWGRKEGERIGAGPLGVYRMSILKTRL
ncbi:hypothetical protein N7449_000703 [Penicillium cf. viridicatum]|uniref:Uncharacterized protein n=1 Tax=Penicillium cf. viridicatum TaxID=2972119 RepID=A0A9W9N6C3_9EURO|nr:hypothetical protein N7449_000703 [Penicillium cf. viridicatum]